VKRRSGSTLLAVIVIATLLMALAVILTRIVYNSYVTEALIGQREKAFWLAEAGLEAGKARLAKDPDWYTDLAGAATVGEPGELPSGSFLIVRARGQNTLCSFGSSGKAKVGLQITFATAPLRTLTWTEL
jgi:hypothetical protein